MESTDKTGKKQYRTGQFLPGQSGNPNGRPPGSKDYLRELLDVVSTHEIKITRARQKKLGIDKDTLTTLEHILLDWATSLSPAKQAMFIERMFGGVPRVNVNQNQSNFDFMKYASKFTDAELEAIKNGSDPLEILVAKLPDVDRDENE
jgi:hypothetical protein